MKRVMLAGILMTRAASADGPTAEQVEAGLKTHAAPRAEALSGAVCAARQMRAYSLEQLKKQDAYDRASGITDVEKRKEYRGNLAEADQAERAANLALKKDKLKLIDCKKNGVVFNLAQCLLGSADEMCDGGIYAGAANWLRHAAVWATDDGG